MLELGGKCITIVDESANARVAGMKVINGRLTNCGQTCIAPDYVYVHESKKQEFLDSALATIKEMYGDDPKENKWYSRLINDFHAKRVLALAENTGGKILCGGKGNAAQKYIEPTVIDNPREDSEVMKEEIFGPILPIKTFKIFDEILKHMQKAEKPLAMYYFGDVRGNKNKDLLEYRVQAGMMAVNDVVIQAANPDLPFGGVGYSGQGCYCGIDGFKNFSNSMAVLVKPAINVDAVNKLVIPPFSDAQQKQLRFLLTTPIFQSQVQKALLMVGIILFLAIIYKLGIF